LFGQQPIEMESQRNRREYKKGSSRNRVGEFRV
jgi:hypothetical protein